MKLFNFNLNYAGETAARYFLIISFVLAATSIIQAQTLDAFNPGANANVIDIFPLADGKILVGGTFSTIAGQSKRNIARLNADGTFDATFTTETDITGSILQFIVQPDGKILLTGGFATVNGVSRIRVARINADGTLDTGFNVNLTVPIGVGRAALQPNGKIILPISSGGINRVLRINADGSADNTFSSPIFNATVSSAVLQPDGKVLVIGGFTTADGEAHKNIARLNANGSIDNSFGNPNPDGIIFRLLLSPDGKLYVTGNFSTIGGLPRSYFARLNSDGTTDTSFQNTAAGPANRTGSQSFLQPDGKIVISGSFETIGGVARRRLARLNTNGTLDTTFRDMLVGSGPTDSVQVLSRQPNGKILLGGFFTTVDGAPRAQIARITSDDTGNTRRPAFDFDGDGKTDLSIFRPAPGEWWYLRSSDGGNYAAQFGASSDKIVPADYTGDGKTDVAIWRPSTGEWFVLRSEDNSFYSFPFGVSTDIPTPADFDGDGLTDPAVFRPSSATWFIVNSRGGTTITTFGANGDLPVAADYDGDGFADIGIFRPSTGAWWLNRSSAGAIVTTFGTSSDKTVQADYTGDGKADVAIFRPLTGEWFILRSENSSFYSVPFGTTGDIPAPGDYDGDGIADVTVFRPSTATWYISGSTAGTQIAGFGAIGDQPVPNAFVR